jgi:predicted RNA-binding protein with PUA-like domain
MNYWLFKSEPDTFSIDDLKRDGTTEWSGVRNFQARNTMQAMALGDLGFFYHSSCKPPGIAGIVRVSAAAHPDSSQFDPKSEYHDGSSRKAAPKWWCVDVAYVTTAPRFVPLDELRTMDDLVDMPLLRRGQRLSVQPVSVREWKAILRAAGIDPKTLA